MRKPSECTWMLRSTPEHFPRLDTPKPLTDLLSGSRTSGADKKIALDPYQTVWLTQG
jgi:hypothetical protein